MTATGLKSTTTQFIKEHSTIQPNEHSTILAKWFVFVYELRGCGFESSCSLHLRYFRESWKRHCSLSLLLFYQVNVILTIRKKKESNKFSRLKCFPPENKANRIQPNTSPREYRPIKCVLSPYYVQGVLAWHLGICLSIIVNK